MADNLLYFSVFDDVKTREDLLGYTLTNPVTGFYMTVSGILETDYEAFSYVGESLAYLFRGDDYPLANACLSYYRSVFGGPEFREKLQNDTYYVSAEKIQFEKKTEKTKEQDTQQAASGDSESPIIPSAHPFGLIFPSMEAAEQAGYRFRILKSEITYGTFASESLLENQFGIRIDSDQIEEINWMKNAIDQGFTDFGGMHVSMLSSFISPSVVPSGFFTSDSSENVPTIIVIENTERHYQESIKLDYLGKLLLLGNSHRENTRNIRIFTPQLTEASWWQDDAKKVKNELTVYSVMDELLKNIGQYLTVTNGLYGSYAWILLAMIVVAVFFYLVLSIQKNGRDIGIFRSVGASRGTVMLIYSALSLILVIASFLAAIGGSLLLTEWVNVQLSDGLGSVIVFYSISFRSVLRAALAVGVSTALALLCVWTWLRLRNPVDLIYHRNES